MLSHEVGLEQIVVNKIRLNVTSNATLFVGKCNKLLTLIFVTSGSKPIVHIDILNFVFIFLFLFYLLTFSRKLNNVKLSFLREQADLTNRRNCNLKLILWWKYFQLWKHNTKPELLCSIMLWMYGAGELVCCRLKTM